MNKKIVKEFIDNSFGFPILIINAPFIKVENEWILDISPRALELSVLRALAHKPVSLCGDEVKFIRQYFNFTLKAFAKRFDVSHPAVIKWESSGKKPTKMNWTTEKDLRLFVFSHINATATELFKTYKLLEEKPNVSSKYLPLKVQSSNLEAA